MATDYRRSATVKRQSSGSWAVHVISRVDGKRVLLGTYHTRSLADDAVDRYARQIEIAPEPPKESPARQPSQPNLFPFMDDD